MFSFLKPLELIVKFMLHGTKSQSLGKTLDKTPWSIKTKISWWTFGVVFLLNYS